MDEHESVRLTYHIGIPEPAQYFEEAVIKEACRLAGGCTVSRDIGYWIAGAEEAKYRYSGPLGEEMALTIVITVPDHAALRTADCMQSCICQEARSKDIYSDWVHVEWERVSTRHFSILKERP